MFLSFHIKNTPRVPNLIFIKSDNYRTNRIIQNITCTAEERKKERKKKKEKLI